MSPLEPPHIQESEDSDGSRKAELVACIAESTAHTRFSEKNIFCLS